jgi:ferredoxin/flavodoxin
MNLVRTVTGMIVTVFYFSGTGNTKWAAEQLQSSFSAAGHVCEIISLDNEADRPEEHIRKSDAIGFAFPIYGADMPDIMRCLLETPAFSEKKWNKPAFVVTTAGYMDAFGPFAAAKLLKSFHLAAYIKILMSNNVSTPKLKGHFISDGRLKQRLTQGRKKTDTLVGRLSSGSKYIRNIGPYLLPGMLIRRQLKKAKAEAYRELSVDGTKCTRCLRCVRSCPTRSIVYTGGAFTFLSSCTACMRCYNFCPAYAILHGGKYADPAIYKRYRGPV